MKTTVKKITFNSFKKRHLCILLISLLLAGCEKEAALSGQSVIESGTIQREKTELDKWILDTFTHPYGIEVEYRWDKNVSVSGNYTYPPEISTVKSVLETIKTLWIDLYTSPEIGGKNFFRGKNPLKIYMYGGNNVDANGMILLGNPEATSNEMFLYNVNGFDPKNEDKVFILMRSVHHQFARLLMEIFPYNRSQFLAVSRNKYIESSKPIAHVFRGAGQGHPLFTLARYANKKGFLTYHSFLSPENDFAEIISCKLTHTPKDIIKALIEAKTPYQSWGDPVMQQIYDREAREAHKELEEKLALAEDYFSKEINIPLNYLQVASVKQLKAFTKQQ